MASKVTRTVTIRHCHTPAIQDFYCQHNTPDCKHHPTCWIEYYAGSGVWSWRPAYFDSDPSDVIDAESQKLFGLMRLRHESWDDEYEDMA